MSKILHITVLNPAIHTRIFYKIALSQHYLGFDVTVAGQGKNAQVHHYQGIKIVPRLPFGRFSWKRIWRHFELFALAWREKPDMITTHAAELIWVILLYKLFRPAVHLVYDVHENYNYNIRYSHPNPNVFHVVLSDLVRRMEKFSVQFLDAVCYAEECYENILDVPSEKKYFLRNKFTFRAAEGTISVKIPTVPYMLYTGTIDANRGIWETLELWQKINEIRPLLLVVAGHTFSNSLVEDIQAFVDKSNISHQFILYGGISYLEYSNIIELIRNCWFGTGFYKVERKNIAPIIPTKIYEFMAFSKPLIFNENPHWNTLNARWNFGIGMTEQQNIADFLKLLAVFPKEKQVVENYSWETEEVEMKRMFRNVFPQEIEGR
jgi:glycosyltransferase involved in cell wall biosynthesis